MFFPQSSRGRITSLEIQCDFSIELSARNNNNDNGSFTATTNPLLRFIAAETAAHGNIHAQRDDGTSVFALQSLSLKYIDLAILRDMAAAATTTTTTTTEKETMVEGDAVSLLKTSENGTIYHGPCSSSHGLFQNLQRLEVTYGHTLESISALEALTVPPNGNNKSESSLLRELIIRECPLPSLLPVGILQHFSHVRRLDLEGCGSFSSLHGIEALALLEVLSLRYTAIQSLQPLEHLEQLRSLDISDVHALTDLSGLEFANKPQFVHLDASNSGVRSLVPLRHTCRRLERLLLRDCAQLQSLEGLEKMKDLREVRLSACRRVSSLAPLEASAHTLRTLFVDQCPVLRYLDGFFERMTALEELHIGETQVFSLAPLRPLLVGSSSRLRMLNASGCGYLYAIDNLFCDADVSDLVHSGSGEDDALDEDANRQDSDVTLEPENGADPPRVLDPRSPTASSVGTDPIDPGAAQTATTSSPWTYGAGRHLETLNLSDCGIGSLLPLRHLCTAPQHKLSASQGEGRTETAAGSGPALRRLDINNCSAVQSLEGIEGLVNLEVLTARLAPIASLIPLAHCWRIQHVSVAFSSNLKSLHGLEHMVYLQTLHVEWTGIESLRPLQHCLSLRILNICNCSSLTSLDGIQQLLLLEELDASDTAISALAPLQLLAIRQSGTSHSQTRTLAEPFQAEDQAPDLRNNNNNLSSSASFSFRHISLFNCNALPTANHKYYRDFLTTLKRAGVTVHSCLL